MPRTAAPRQRPPALKRVRLHEDLALTSAPLTVDRDKGVIHRVKVLGWQSLRGRRYLPEAARTAIPLYEGVRVFTDHAEKGLVHARHDEDAFGRLCHVVWESDGLYADLQYFKTHPLAGRVLEDIDRGLGVFGLSHNALGESRLINGEEVVHAIKAVESVDIVSKGATTKNLWESLPMSKTYKQFLADSKSPKAKTLVKRMLAESMCREDDTMEASEEPSTTEHLLNALAQAIEEDPELADKIWKLLRPEKPAAETEDDPPVAVTGDDDKDKKKKDDEKERKTESVVRDLQRQLAYRDLCEDAGVRPTKTFLKALVQLEESDAKALIEEQKAKGDGTPPAPRGTAPKSQAPGSGKPMQESAIPKFGDGEEGRKKRLAYMRNGGL